MNLLCPNCQKQLSVGDQYAGQLMKCPLCQGTFTVPTLPSGESSPSTPPSSPETFGFKDEPVSPPRTTPPALDLSDADAVDEIEEVAPPGGWQERGRSTGPSVGYTRNCGVTFSPKVLQWIVPAGLLLILVLHFFPWVRVAAGSVTLASQGAYGTAFGSYSLDEELEKIDKDSKGEMTKRIDEKLGTSVLMILYILLFWPTFLITVAFLILTLLRIQLPAALQGVMRWRWGIVAALNMLLFLFLVLQLLIGFSAEAAIREDVEKGDIADMKKLASSGAPSSAKTKVEDAIEGVVLSLVKRSFWLQLAFWLHILVTVSAALLFWIEQRGSMRPFPRLEMQW